MAAVRNKKANDATPSCVGQLKLLLSFVIDVVQKLQRRKQRKVRRAKRQTQIERALMVSWNVREEERGG